jgi:hypothetical protein
LKNTFSKSIGGHMEIVKKTILDLAMPKLWFLKVNKQKKKIITLNYLFQMKYN